MNIKHLFGNILIFPLICILIGLNSPSHAYTQNFSPTNATVQLWLEDELSQPPAKVEYQYELDEYILPKIARLTTYQPKSDELLEQGVVLNYPAPDGTFYRYTFYKGGLVACQVGGKTLWYREASSYQTTRHYLLGMLVFQWQPPADAVRPVPLTDQLAQIAPFAGDLDAPVDVQWLQSQMKAFDSEEDWTVYIEPGSLVNIYHPVKVTDAAFRQRILSMVSSPDILRASRQLGSGGQDYVWLVKGDEIHLYGTMNFWLQNFQTPGAVKSLYADNLNEELQYFLAVEQARATAAGK